MLAVPKSIPISDPIIFYSFLRVISVSIYRICHVTIFFKFHVAKCRFTRNGRKNPHTLTLYTISAVFQHFCCESGKVYARIPLRKISIPIPIRISPPKTEALPSKCMPTNLPTFNPPRQMIKVTTAMMIAATKAITGG